jgi:hypothetical protein
MKADWNGAVERRSVVGPFADRRIGQPMGPATLSHQSLQCCAGQFVTRTDLACCLVGQLEFELHGNFVYDPITGLARLSGIAVHATQNLFTAAKKELARKPTPHSPFRRAQ